MSGAVWRRVFTWSPLISLIGAAAGGLLLTRLIFIFTGEESIVTGERHQTFGPDILAAVLVLAVWVVGAFVLLHPPPSELAHVDGPRRPEGVVWPLARRFRAPSVWSTPVSGLVLVFIASLPIAFLAHVPATEAAGIASLFAVMAALLAVFIARASVVGVQLTPTALIARGYLFTRRYPREAIDNVRRVKIRGLADWGMAILMNNSSDYFALNIRFTSGRSRVLYASNSSPSDIELGVNIVRAWLQAPDDAPAMKP